MIRAFADQQLVLSVFGNAGSSNAPTARKMGSRTDQRLLRTCYLCQSTSAHSILTALFQVLKKLQLDRYAAMGRSRRLQTLVHIPAPSASFVFGRLTKASHNCRNSRILGGVDYECRRIISSSNRRETSKLCFERENHQTHLSPAHSLDSLAR